MGGTALVVLFVFIQSHKQATSPPFFSLSKHPRDERQQLVYSVSGLPNLPNRGIETEIFVAQAVCHPQR